MAHIERRNNIERICYSRCPSNWASHIHMCHSECYICRVEANRADTACNTLPMCYSRTTSNSRPYTRPDSMCTRSAPHTCLDSHNNRDTRPCHKVHLPIQSDTSTRWGQCMCPRSRMVDRTQIASSWRRHLSSPGSRHKCSRPRMRRGLNNC